MNNLSLAKEDHLKRLLHLKACQYLHKLTPCIKPIRMNLTLKRLENQVKFQIQLHISSYSTTQTSQLSLQFAQARRFSSISSGSLLVRFHSPLHSLPRVPWLLTGSVRLDPANQDAHLPTLPVRRNVEL